MRCVEGVAPCLISTLGPNLHSVQGTERFPSPWSREQAAHSGGISGCDDLSSQVGHVLTALEEECLQARNTNKR